VRTPFRATVVAPILVCALAISAIAVAANWSRSTPSTRREAPRHLRVHGGVAHLSPGQKTTYRVRVRNPLSVRVRVYRVGAHVRRGRGPLGRCPARSLRVRPWSGRRVIPPHSMRKVPLVVRMRRSAPDRCQGTRWRLIYVAKSVRPGLVGAGITRPRSVGA
jgi:hypothetical protein